ncbi:PREDICTED: uncharacterized protein LOC105462172 [Wasmannia auropunctata]|uniref:uncharacterized protein LOC105462172 n=1 Tax=Wasmannia auropunctata TaxID=64793 RepID=UPI0005EDDC60|nr:PREDICTED: uncharacterized protein LOC105462172 [Wasmannia auropunctata]
MSSVSCFLFCVLWITIFDKVQLTKTEDVLDKIKAGLQYASNYLETAKDIADLVSKSLGHKQKQKRGEDGNDEKQPFGPSNFVSAFLRLIRFDSQKVAAIAVNSVVFLAQMISTLFGLKSSQSNIARNMDDEEFAWDPLKFTLENKNENIRNLVDQARNPNLPNQLIARVTGSDFACIRLLLCKSSPIIHAAQTSLNNKSQDYMHRIIGWLPSKEDFEISSDECEKIHTDCRLFS